jgi:hypothetical protein
MFTAQYIRVLAHYSITGTCFIMTWIMCNLFTTRTLKTPAFKAAGRESQIDSNLINCPIYKGYSESKLQWAVNKTSKKKKILYTKNTYIHKLFLNSVAAGTEALVVSGNEFFNACVKEVCRLWAQPRLDTFKQLIIAETLWSHPLLQVGKQVVVARSEIRALRRVAKQLPVQMLQQCSIASSLCGRAMSWCSTTPDVNIPCLYFWMALGSFLDFARNTMIALLGSLGAWIPPSSPFPVLENSCH